MRAGFSVRVCLTDSAEKFVTSALFEALTGQPCLTGVFEEPERGRMAHIDWARQSEFLLVAPATANTLSKLAFGIGDDMLTTIALAHTGIKIVAPAMNPAMFADGHTQEALARLESQGYIVVEPSDGEVACGENGQGKLASNSEIVQRLSELNQKVKKLAGKRVLITTGPTHEPIDEVRYLTNRSSGKMGTALARAAQMMGAEVIVITGPSHVPLPAGVTIERVTTADEMLIAALKYSGSSDYIIGCAAVSDYRPIEKLKGKIRRSAEHMRLDLVANPDVLAHLAANAPNAKVIAFAAEPSGDLEEAWAKKQRKGAFALAMNDISRRDIGFETDENDLTLLFADQKVERSGKRSKLACALWLLNHVV
jgi:phosphopantothenoylcysteine decarboxylase/phosphopantothenate--cysteine ligase